MNIHGAHSYCMEVRRAGRRGGKACMGWNWAVACGVQGPGHVVRPRAQLVQTAVQQPGRGVGRRMVVARSNRSRIVYSCNHRLTGSVHFVVAGRVFPFAGPTVWNSVGQCPIPGSHQKHIQTDFFHRC